jgi:hypothetical protein
VISLNIKVQAVKGFLAISARLCSRTIIHEADILPQGRSSPIMADTFPVLFHGDRLAKGKFLTVAKQDQSLEMHHL